MGCSTQLVSFGIVSLAAGLGVGVNGWNALVSAQITPDGTLGPESSVVERGVVNGITVDQIEGGAIRANVLFHSFEEFNISEGRRAYFSQPGGIESILGRVTGENASEIMGRLGVLGDADLFLLNPNGIVFGPNASLDIAGSFMATTAEEFEFADGAAFSAVNSEAAPLLTVGVTPGLQWGAGGDAGDITTQADLSVGQDLTFAAGKVAIDGTLIAGGDLRIEGVGGSLGSVTSGEGAVFQSAGDVAMQDYEGASLQVLAGGSVTIPGDVVVNSASGVFNDSSVEVSDGETLVLSGSVIPTVDIRAGLRPRLRSATDRSVTAGGDRSVSEVERSGIERSADITIGTINNPGRTVFLSNRFNPNLTGDIELGTISTDDFSGGGDIVIDAQGGITVRNIDASGGNRNAVRQFERPEVSFDLIGGNGGDINLLAAGDIFMPYPSFIDSRGLRGGRISVVSDTAIIQEQAPPNPNPGPPFWGALSQVSSYTFGSQKGKEVVFSAPTIDLGGNVVVSTLSEGDSGDLSIIGDALSISQGVVVTTTAGAGDAGKVNANVEESISLGIEAGLPSSLGSATLSGAEGNAGNVDVASSSIEAINGGEIESIVLDFYGTQNGQGNAGNVTVIADHIQLSGFNSVLPPATRISTSSIVSQTELGAVGSGGDITIETQTLDLSNGATVTTALFGNGRAGDITIDASEYIRIDGAIFAAPLVDFSQPSSIDSQISPDGTATGDGGRGNITINTPRIELANGGSITATSNGNGSAGSIDITVTDSIMVDGATLFPQEGIKDQFSRIAVVSGPDATGDAGNIDINAPTITLSNGGEITAALENRRGNAGKIDITVNALLLRQGGLINAETISGEGGDIRLDIGDRLTLRNSDISASTTDGTGGNITLNRGNPDADTTVRLRNGSTISTEATGIGSAGQLRFNLAALTLTGRKTQISAQTEAEGGTAGNIRIAADRITVGDRASIVASNVDAQAGGNIKLVQLETLELNDGSISVETNSGEAGNIRIRASDALALTGSNARISAQARENDGRAGDIIITGPLVTVTDEATIEASNRDAGDGGNINFRDLQTLTLRNGQIIATTQTGQAGNIDIAASEQVRLQDGSTLSVATTESEGTDNTPELETSPKVSRSRNGDANVPTAGSLVIESDRLDVESDSAILVQSPNGQAGNIDITARLIQLNTGTISAETNQNSQTNLDSATINIRDFDLLLLENKSSISAQANESADGGNITITSPNGLIAAPLLNDSDIIAIAERGQGGNINISVNQLFGFTVRATTEGLDQNRTNDISASSAAGPQGIVNINTLNTDPDQGLIELLGILADPPPPQSLCNAAVASGSEFIITGRGGIPPGPADLPSPSSTWEDWYIAEPSTDIANTESNTASNPSHQPNGTIGELEAHRRERAIRVSHRQANASSSPVTEAQGWITADDGTVQLVLSSAATTPASAIAQANNCRNLSSSSRL